MTVIAKRIDLVWLDIFTRETGLTQGNMVTGDWEYDRIGNSYEYVIQFDPQRPNTPRGKYALAYVTIHKETDDQGATFSHTVVDITNTDRPAANFDSTSDFQVTQSSGLTFDISSGTHTGDGLFTQAASTSAVRNTLSWSVPQGQYDVRLKRITADSSSDQVRDEVQWTALRNIKHTEPVDPTFAADKKIAQTQVIIKATDQLNGIVDQLNAVCSSILPDYEPQSGTWVERTTSNCASIAREIWQGKSSKKPVPDSRLDLDALESLWQRCNDRLMQYNGVIQGGSADDALKQVLSNARASRSLIDGIRSVVIDEEKTDVVQHFTPRNSRNFRGSKRFAEQPHALKIRFQNRAQGYAQDEVIVYDDGYSADGTDCEFNAADGSCSVATKFETMDTKGIVLGEQAHQYGRYQLAANKLRPENYSLDVDVEHLVATRGDLVRVTHDVPVFGLASGRVKAIQTSGSDTTGVTLDEELELAASTDYTMRFRLSNGDTLTRDIQQLGSDTVTDTVTFQSSIATSSGPAAGDLAMFGLIDQETVECIVKAITGGDPEWGATLELVDHAQPAIDNSADSAIPAFESNITENPFTRQIPPDVRVEEVRSDEAALVTHSDGSLESAIMVSYQLPSNDRFQPESAQFRYRKSGDSVSWEYQTGEPQKGVIHLRPVDTGSAYDVEARSLARDGIAGNWVAVASDHTVTGKTNPPPDVPFLNVTQDGEAVMFGWGRLFARDLKGYEIRFGERGIATWDDSLIVSEVEAGTRTTKADIPPGDWTFFIKGQDRSGNESVEPAIRDYEVTTGYQDIHSLQHHDTWPGERVNFDVVATILEPTNVSYAYYATPTVDLDYDEKRRIWAGLSLITQSVDESEDYGLITQSVTETDDYLYIVGDIPSTTQTLYGSINDSVDTTTNYGLVTDSVSNTENYGDLWAASNPTVVDWGVLSESVPRGDSRVSYQIATRKDGENWTDPDAAQTDYGSINSPVTNTTNYGLITDSADTTTTYDTIIPWQEWQKGAKLHRYVKQRVVVESDEGDGLLLVRRFLEKVDFEQRTERHSGESIASGGTTIAFDKRFHFVPTAVAEVQSTGAVYPVKSDIDEFGVTYRVRDSDGNAVSTSNLSFTVTGV